MPFAPIVSMRTCACAAALLVGASAAWHVPAAAKEPMSLKEVLGKTQTEAEKKAVEDLVDKLKGVPRKATPPPAPATPPADTAKAPEPPKAPQAKAPEASTPQAKAPETKQPAPSAETAAPGGSTTSGGSTQPTPGPKTAAPSPPPAEPPPRVASPAPPPVAQTLPDAAVDNAAQKRAPSIDLEVLFAYKSAEITREAMPVLTTLGRALRDARISDDAFLIAGHTDAKGGDAYNLELSQRRAESVRQFLIANFGIDGKKLVAKGYGLQRLKNSGEPFAAENRRVQIVNLSKDGAR